MTITSQVLAMSTENAYPLLSVEQALDRVLASVAALPAVETPLLQALDLVLAEDVRAPLDVPMHANSAMDGYALRAADAAGDGAELPVVGDVAAGHPWQGPVGPGQALRIMTGAPLPAGADTVVRFEDTVALDDGRRVRIIRAPKLGANVRLAGEDVRAGDIALARGTLLRPQELGLLAALGCTAVRVHRRPVVAVLSTGDELAAPGAPLKPGQVYDSNTHTLAAQVLRAGGQPWMLAPAPDRERMISARLAAASSADLIVTSGGVSVGDYDLVKNVLASAGRIDFWWVNMKPGKPLAFGRVGRVPLLALPGNPVAAMLSFHLFGRPAIYKARGLTTWEAPSVSAVLAEPVTRKDGRRHYLRVRLEPEGDHLLARLTGDQGSGILSSLTACQGVAVIPEDCDHLDAGAVVTVLLLG